MTQDEFAIEALRRLPVAASLLSVFAIICSAERMAKIFSEHRGRSYEDVLSFHGLVRLMFSVNAHEYSQTKRVSAKANRRAIESKALDSLGGWRLFNGSC